jgi:hypothetical protein
LAALLGAEHLKKAASEIFATGSFWFSAAPMAAALATLDLLEEEKGVDGMTIHIARAVLGAAMRTCQGELDGGGGFFVARRTLGRGRYGWRGENGWSRGLRR